ncbi:TIGR03086 family metal-binding protein [Streptomyces sp. NBC_01476]|uniref:TIGR03086 family metal-binding protein n=1 Tax=Streptomyces sp. NBC_01476 TaxID=2903881 RepID=UPI002E342F70|nr:TIGR03086 family metal-binding protein [Streptomyces sp. NBC_01476]
MSENPNESAAGSPVTGLFSAVDLAVSTLAAVAPDQYDNATPCPDYSVRDLCNHVVSVVRRVGVLGAGGEFFSVPHFAEDTADGEWSAAAQIAAKDLKAAWSDPGVLGRQVALPWGPVPGAAAAVIYTNELVLHTWDIAKGTSQRPEFDPAMLAAPLANMKRAVPAENRGGPVPFGPVVEVPDDAPAIDRLVGWYGRRP